MADLKKKLPGNVAGDFYVDSTCINCDTCRKFAPHTFQDEGNTSIVAVQPRSPEEVLQALQALIACPVHAIGSLSQKAGREVLDSFPVPITDEVFVNGFNAESSYGSDSYFIRSAAGNGLIDSPRFTPVLVRKFREMGGLSWIFLTHRDDVADADKYAKEFGARRMIHAYDQAAQKDAEIVLEGTDDKVIGDARIIFTPGHTRGHCVLLWKGRYLFTGDHLPWDDDEKALRPFRDACWYSWKEQIESVRKLAAYPGVEWVLPGHGRRMSFVPHTFGPAIQEAVRWMETYVRGVVSGSFSRKQ